MNDTEYNTLSGTSGQFFCNDCSFISESQGGLGVHCVKKHKVETPDDVKSVSVICEFPKGKSFYCCICNTIIKSWPNFKRHYKNIHPGVDLFVSAVCTWCNRQFKELKGAGVHMNLEHHISSSSVVPPNSPSPIMSTIDFVDSQPPSDDAKTHQVSPVVYVPNIIDNTRCSHRSTRSNAQNNHNTPTSTSNNHTDLSVNIPPPLPPITPVSRNPNSSPCDDSPSPLRASSPSYPEPMISNLVIEDESDTSSPPRPNANSIPNPHRQVFLEPVVALIDCTAGNRNVPNINLAGDVTLPHSSHPTLQLTPEPTVTLSGCTDADGHVVPNISYNPTNNQTASSTTSQNSFNIPPPLSEMSYLSSMPLTSTNNNVLSHNLNMEPLVTLSGSTDENQQVPIDNTTPSSDEDVNNNSQLVTKWSSRFSTVATFDEFCSNCDEFAKEVVIESKTRSGNIPTRQGRPIRNPRNRPYNRVPNQNCRPLLFNPREARRIQILYRLSKKRAARQILQDNNTTYTGTKEQAQNYFSDTLASSSVDLDDLVSSLSDNVPSTEVDSSIMEPMTPKEIKDKLRRMSNSAPGKDRVEYRHLKKVDPDCKVLGQIFNKCLEENKVPLSWKQSTTILIYKKGSSEDPSNFRPIALMSCIYKLFTSILAARVSSFAMDNNLISPEQKSAKPSEGCDQHSFTLQSVVADCKRNQKNCFFTWLDLRNAFGSISHETIYTTLEHMGFPNTLIDLIKDIYTDAETIVRTNREDETDPISVNAGVKQGCPISPILFNLTTELIVRAVKTRCNENSDISYKLHDNPVFVLAYADDLVLISQTRDGLQTLLDDVSKAADTLNLHFRPDKCASLSLTCNKREPSTVGDSVFQVQNGNIPMLLKEESYRYLGVPIGILYDAEDMNKITEKLIKDLEKIRDSLLAPWQKLDAIRTFIQPCLTYALRTCPVTRESLNNYRNKLVQVLRSICNLPKRSTTHYFFADRAVGGLGLQDPYDE